MPEGPRAQSPEEWEALQRLGATLDQAFDEGFVLVTSKGGWLCTAVISNMDPSDLLATLKVLMAQLEGQPMTPGRA